MADPKFAVEPRDIGTSLKQGQEGNGEVPPAPKIVFADSKWSHEERDVPVPDAPTIVVADPKFADEGMRR